MTEPRCGKCEELLVALKEIRKREGRFSMDPGRHCANTVEDMSQLAENAIAKHEGREPERLPEV